ncbi:FmdE family protein [Calderihabitans maritimus]|uniref:Formylmethanofuran dehydrogenase subunit E n=1 Tax=Calderihabitans maritimus TaxID=1246530 RepID=A0A1Z5HT48_9FIRM|nr:FmdE family protein [Calderihabitans maritimus]GAW92501.1 formylmethanofuran dehydrogenase subunit E [Calderihabitans maritimus]
MAKKYNCWEEAVKFHGHACPGLAMGVRASEIALERLGVDRAKDEELVAIVETDACGVDGIQVLTGCTFGKGNLIFKDYGKQAFTLAKRSNGQGYRVVFKPLQFDDESKKIREKVFKGAATEEENQQFKRIQDKMIEQLLKGPVEEICTVNSVKINTLRKARIFDSIRCEKCGEYFMEPRARRQDGKTVCLECFEEYVSVKFK